VKIIRYRRNPLADLEHFISKHVSIYSSSYSNLP
jgi:hypothetical protein